MSDIIYRFDVKGRHKPAGPATPKAAIDRLEAGNRRFVELLDGPATGSTVVRFDADDIGTPNADGSPPTQKPFAAVLACADARVPVEMIFGQACNDLFVVRVAGNVLGAECLGSLDYAVSTMKESIRVLVVLGHSNCGAVTAAVDAFMEPSQYLTFASSHPLRSIVDRLFVAVRSAHQSLESVFGQKVERKPGYRTALLHTSVVLNAALQAATLKSEFAERMGPKMKAVYGVYDLATRSVRMNLEKDDDLKIELATPPTNDEGFRQLGILMAGSEKVRELVMSA